MANNYSIPAIEKYEWYEENVVMEYPTLDTKATGERIKQLRKYGLRVEDVIRRCI